MRTFLIPALLAMAAATANADAPLWLRDAAISPDGSAIAFTYKGDIFSVPVNGGAARQLTSNKAYESRPVWSPDGSKIAFRSDRMGSDDIFIMAKNGGKVTRLTTGTGTETPLAFLNDSTLLFSASEIPARNSVQAPFLGQTFTVDVNNPGLRP